MMAVVGLLMVSVAVGTIHDTEYGFMVFGSGLILFEFFDVLRARRNGEDE